MPDLTPVTDPEPGKPKQALFNKFSKKTFIIAGGGIFLIIAITLAFAFTSPKKYNSEEISQENLNSLGSRQRNDNQKTETNQAKTLLNTIIYGSWVNNQSIIRSLDATSRKSTILATLPFTVKNVSVLSPQQLVYIDQTNDQDHGKQINSYQVKDKSTKTLIKSSAGFGIDDYVLSPNKQYMAIWEVQLAPGTNVLQGGQSRVYAVKLSNPTDKKLIYDEKALSPVHYPRAVLDDGRVITDKFYPNDPQGGAGWAYGIGISNFDGSNKKDLENMQEGTYGTKPEVSPDGKYLVFSGYDGSEGDGKSVKNGFRQALLTPNTVELLDLLTLKRSKLPNLSNDDLYTSSGWDKSTGNIIVSTISKVEEREGLFSYNIQQKSMKKLNIPETDATSYTYISHLSDSNLLIGLVDTSTTSVGNLGDEYASSISKLYNYDLASNQAISLPLESTFIQYITSLPSNYFTGVLGANVLASQATPPIPQPTFIDLYSDYNSTKKNLQLYTFLFKTDLTEKREEQQSDPIPTATPAPTIIPRGVTPGPTRKATPFPTPSEVIHCNTLAQEQCKYSSDYSNCYRKAKVDLREQGRCNQSPLYLYGDEGQKVKVKVQTTIYNDVPSQNGEYNTTLLPEGLMKINNQTYDSIDYDYRPNLRKLTQPSKGIITSKADLKAVLTKYALGLSLNKKETDDLVRFGEENIKSDYIFISFFDQATSEKILPLEFTPRPKNYRNVVLYFKQLTEEPKYTPIPPVFPPKLNRTGLTAFEISEIVE